MKISRDKEFTRRKDEARRPAREPVKDTLAGKDRSVQDFDLRRARDVPVASEGRHRTQRPGPAEQAAPDSHSASAEAVSEEQKSYLSDREAEIGRASCRERV